MDLRKTPSSIPLIITSSIMATAAALEKIFRLSSIEPVACGNRMILPRISGSITKEKPTIPMAHPMPYKRGLKTGLLKPISAQW